MDLLVSYFKSRNSIRGWRPLLLVAILRRLVALLVLALPHARHVVLHLHILGPIEARLHLAGLRSNQTLLRGNI